MRMMFLPLCLFQFHYGTIKSLLASLRIRYRLADFNSTMVRLKVVLEASDKILPLSFQFHYGTIKSPRLQRNFRPISISIPLWYD